MREAVWRLGHASDPLGFVPRPLCGWQHRWDDPRRAYRTLYTAEASLTCLREVLADLRPNTKVLAELRDLFGADASAAHDAGVVTVACSGRSECLLQRGPSAMGRGHAYGGVNEEETMPQGIIIGYVGTPGGRDALALGLASTRMAS